MASDFVMNRSAELYLASGGDPSQIAQYLLNLGFDSSSINIYLGSGSIDSTAVESISSSNPVSPLVTAAPSFPGVHMSGSSPLLPTSLPTMPVPIEEHQAAVIGSSISSTSVATDPIGSVGLKSEMAPANALPLTVGSADFSSVTQHGIGHQASSTGGVLSDLPESFQNQDSASSVAPMLAMPVASTDLFQVQGLSSTSFPINVPVTNSESEGLSGVKDGTVNQSANDFLSGSSMFPTGGESSSLMGSSTNWGENSGIVSVAMMPVWNAAAEANASPETISFHINSVLNPMNASAEVPSYSVHENSVQNIDLSGLVQELFQKDTSLDLNNCLQFRDGKTVEGGQSVPSTALSLVAETQHLQAGVLQQLESSSNTHLNSDGSQITIHVANFVGVDSSYFMEPDHTVNPNNVIL